MMWDGVVTTPFFIGKESQFEVVRQVLDRPFVRL